MIKLLIQKKANPTIITKSGKKILHGTSNLIILHMFQDYLKRYYFNKFGNLKV